MTEHAVNHATMYACRTRVYSQTYIDKRESSEDATSGGVSHFLRGELAFSRTGSDAD